MTSETVGVGGPLELGGVNADVHLLDDQTALQLRDWTDADDGRPAAQRYRSVGAS